MSNTSVTGSPEEESSSSVAPAATDGAPAGSISNGQDPGGSGGSGGAGVLPPPTSVTRRSFEMHAAVIGVVAGLVAVAFGWALHRVEHQHLHMLAYLHEHHPSWGWAVLPAVALVVGSIVGLMVQKIEPDASGSGIPHIKSVILRLRPMRWQTLIPVKFVGGVLGVGIGLSLGREGPTVQLGAAVAQGLSRFWNVPPRVMPQLLSCGAGAGLAAAFNAPLAGFVFVIDELRREMSRLTYAGALIAAVCADIVARSLVGELPTFHLLVKPTPLSVWTLPAVAMTGVLGAVCAIAFNKMLLASRVRAQNTKLTPQWMLPGIAAAICALVAWWLPEVVGGGNVTAEHALNGGFVETAGTFVLLVFAAKFVLSIVSYASGAPGGVFAPMLLMGSLMGLLIGRTTHALVPGLEIDERSMAVIGMAAFFTGSVRAPLTGCVLILEMSGNYELLFPIAVACMAAYLLAEKFGGEPLYEALMANELRRKGLHKDHHEPTPVVMGIQHGSALDGKRLRDACLPQGCWVVGIERQRREIVPAGDTELQAGDHVTILVPGDAPALALKIVEMCRVG